MKNYYEILGIDPQATKEEIENAYRDFAKKLSKGQITNEEFKNMTEAYEILINAEVRELYDEKLNAEIEQETEQFIEEPGTEVVYVRDVEPEKEKSRLNINNKAIKIVAGGLVLLTVAGIGYSCGKDNKINSNDTTITTQNPDKEKLVLNGSNFDSTVASIMKSAHDKGLDIKEEIVRSALLLVNLDVLSDEDLVKLAGEDINMQHELQNLLDYVSMVETHNLSANNSLDKHIPLYTLAYDELDRAMLKELDVEYMDLMEDIQNKELKDEDKAKTIASTINYIYEFAIGSGKLDLTDGDYNKLNLGSGAGILAESYMTAIAEEVRNVTKNEYKLQINAIAENTNGLSYINDIYKTEIPCLESEKTLTK